MQRCRVSLAGMRVLIPFFAALFAACSSGSGLDGKLVVSQLSAADWGKYCDWANGRFGAVGGKSCMGGALVPAYQLNCAANVLAGSTVCTATVSQAESCTNKFKDNACDGLSAVLKLPECTNVSPCGNGLFMQSTN